MEKLKIFILYIFLLHFSKCLAPNKSLNNFLNFAEENLDIKCSTTSLTNQFCIKHEENVINYNHCEKVKRKEYCGSYNGDDLKCVPVLKFHGEECSSNTDCFSKNCVNHICQYKDDKENCAGDKECKETSYCNADKVCIQYYTKKDDTCDSNKRCSPRFICKDSKCILKGTEDIGKSVVEADLCKTFKVDSNGKCTDKYDLENINDYLAYRRSIIYPIIDWESVKLSDLTGPNLGDAESAFRAIDMQIKQTILSPFGKDIYECTYQIIKEHMITIDGYYPLSDNDLKNFTMVETEPPSLHDDDGLSGGAIAAIIIGCIIGIALIAGLIYFFFFRKRLSSNNI